MEDWYRVPELKVKELKGGDSLLVLYDSLYHALTRYQYICGVQRIKDNVVIFFGAICQLVQLQCLYREQD
jgi:hypothetical protein